MTPERSYLSGFGWGHDFIVAPYSDGRTAEQRVVSYARLLVESMAGMDADAQECARGHADAALSALGEAL